jgi:hypothetical protein
MGDFDFLQFYKIQFSAIVGIEWDTIGIPTEIGLERVSRRGQKHP